MPLRHTIVRINHPPAPAHHSSFKRHINVPSHPTASLHISLHPIPSPPTDRITPTADPWVQSLPTTVARVLCAQCLLSNLRCPAVESPGDVVSSLRPSALIAVQPAGLLLDLTSSNGSLFIRSASDNLSRAAHDRVRPTEKRQSTPEYVAHQCQKSVFTI